MPIPDPVRLFHITATANLPALFGCGRLYSKNSGLAAGILYHNIAYQGAQAARSRRNVPDPPGGTVHDYVPFYFAPRSPMLLAINGGRVEGCQWRQADIVHLETTVDRVVGEGAAYLFYDRNATLAFSQAYTDLNQLSTAVAWDLLTAHPQMDGYCKYWHNVQANPQYVDRMERRQAEFLIRQEVPVRHFTRVGVLNEEQAVNVRAILVAAGVQLPVFVMPEWYF